MAGVHLIALVAAIVTIAALVEMLRRRQIRQKYAITWVIVGIAVAVVAVAPGLFNGLAHGLGVINPPDLLAVMAALFLLLVTVHLSWELGRLEDRSRLLAEEVALLRADLEERDARSDARSDVRSDARSGAIREADEQAVSGRVVAPSGERGSLGR